MMKKRHVLHLAMGVVMTPLLGSCAADEIVGGAGSGNGVLSFGVEVNVGATEVKPMGGATRSAEKNDSSAVMSPDVDGFFPTSSVELSSVDGNAIYANCDERRGINMHNNVDYKTTRGSIQTTEKFYDSFALYGYVYDSDKNWADANVGSSTNVNNNIDGIEMTKGSDNTWKSSSVYWPGASNKATFFAVAPYSAKSSVTANQGGPQITYTVPQEVSRQEDLLIAKSEDDVTCDGKNAPSLKFNHALAAIKFVEGRLNGYSSISKVEISGVNNKGTLSSFETPSWTEQTKEGSTNTYSISSLNDVMFLMPQTFPDEAEIKVTFSDGSKSQEFTAKLKDDDNTSWQAGHQYTYSLSINKIIGEFIFEVTSLTESVPVDGGSANFTVKSYYKYDNGKTVAIPWSCKNNESSETISGGGENTEETVSVGITKNTSSSHTENLKKATAKGTADAPFNLADPDNKGQDQYTANCYVISAPGVYKLPLVYGNGIYNGSPNNYCYNTSTNYMNHKGTSINSLMPYIYGHGYDPPSGSDGAEVVWTSSTDLVKDAKISSDGKYLIFTVDMSTICQGNAVVAAKYNGTIVWSWHIWVTDTQLTTYKYGSYNFLNMPLGFVDATRDARSINMFFSQSKGGKTKSLTISQAGDASTVCTALFYEWGRKDPFRSSGHSQGGGGAYMYEAIQFPNKFYSIISYRNGKFDWSIPKEDNGYNYWNVGNTTTSTSKSVNKSIYDPSPVGYKLPPCYAFSSLGIGNTGFKVSGKGYLNTSNGDYWHLFGTLDGYSGSFEDYGQGGYWSASPTNSNNSYSLKIYNTEVTTNSQEYFRSAGLSVRPVSE